MGVFACTLLSGVGQGVTGVGLGLGQRSVTSILTTGLVCFHFANFPTRQEGYNCIKLPYVDADRYKARLIL